MNRALVILLIAGLAAFRFTDISSSSAWTAVILPMLDTLVLMGLTLWLITFFASRTSDQNRSSSAHGSGWLDDNSDSER